MKCDDLSRKFQTKLDFVKPLYKKVQFSNKVRPIVGEIDNAKLYDHGRQRKVNAKLNYKARIVKKYNNFFSNAQRDISRNYSVRNLYDRSDFNGGCGEEVVFLKSVRNNYGDLIHNHIGIHNNYTKMLITPTTNQWLRVYPAPKIPGESCCSVFMRCVVCQLGLASIIILWTTLFIFVISALEGPYEEEVFGTFEKEQNQLVIDLATELRQITPFSDKWREAIVKRIEEERLLTIKAVSKGAKLHPGRFWNIAGTFLFTVYVMTALGFGAPVPQTVTGRSWALVYALIAIPTHIFLMMNMSTCLVSHVDRFLHRKKGNQTTENVEMRKAKRNCYIICKNFIGKFFSYGHFIPLTVVIYYTSGAVVFGVMRNKTTYEVLMFPLEFTTTGGLEIVADHVRLGYGFYVEGAMCLLSCVLATLRRMSSPSITSLYERYRLIAKEKPEDDFVRVDEGTRYVGGSVRTVSGMEAMKN